MDFKNNPKLGNETSEVKIRQLEDKIKTLTQNIGDLQTELNYLHNDFEAENVQVNSLPNAEVIESDKAIGYNAQGKLIPIDVTAGTAKWENVEGRANAIKPKNNAEVIVDTVLKLQNTTEETLTGSMVLSLDEAGNVIKVNMLDVVQKKLTEGYNITISADGVISCDIKTMTFKGSVSTFADLPETGNTTGDVWNVTTESSNYCWDGETFIPIGSSVDLSDYYTKSEVDSKTAISEDEGNALERKADGLFVDATSSWTGTQEAFAALDKTTLRNGQQINITNDVASFAADYVVLTGSNANGHYRKWKSGLIEQWGVVTYSDTTTIKESVINFPVSFSETTYSVTVENEYNGSADGYYLSYLKKQYKTVSSVTVRLNPLNSSQHSIGFTWTAKGF